MIVLDRGKTSLNMSVKLIVVKEKRKIFNLKLFMSYHVFEMSIFSYDTYIAYILSFSALEMSLEATAVI